MRLVEFPIFGVLLVQWFETPLEIEGHLVVPPTKSPHSLSLAKLLFVGSYRITVRSHECHAYSLLSSSFVSTNYRYFRYYSVNTLAYVLSGRVVK